MRLADLDAQLIAVDPADPDVRRPVSTIAEAEGVRFLCPKCFVANAGARRTHQVICWSKRVPADATPGPGRWQLQGTGIIDLSLVAYPGSTSSVQLLGGCQWHGFVENGRTRDA